MPVVYLAFNGQRIEQNGAGVKGAIGWPAGGCGTGCRRWPEGEVGFMQAIRHMHKADYGGSRSAGSDLADLAPWCEKVPRFETWACVGGVAQMMGRAENLNVQYPITNVQ